MTGDLHTKNILRFLDAHPKIRILCFDYFDTLVYRIVAPEHTKKLAARQLGLLVKDGFDGEQIYDLRSRLEVEICRKNAEVGNDPEFNILELADAVYDRLNRRDAGMPCRLGRELFKKVFVDIEIAVELRVQRVFPDTRRLLEACKNRGYQTVVVSDFYVPLPFFKKFLDVNGLSSLIDQILVSCDFCRTKASGRFYDKLLATFCCRPEEVMMIGDNAHSDIRMAEEKGIFGYFVDRSAQRRNYQKWASRQKSGRQQQKEVEGRVLARIKRQTGKLFPEMAATLWRFSSLLFDRLIQDEVKDIFFFSKEGEFLKALFEQYQQEQFGRLVIRTHYLLVSRKSTFICSLKPLLEEDFSRLFFQYRVISPRDFLLSLSFTENEAKGLCKELPIAYEERIDSMGFSEPFLLILKNPAFAELFEQKRKTQRENFLRYLYSFGVDFDKEGLHIVDVGWKGSIQDNIFFCLDENVRISGYYLGLLNPTHLTERNRKFGILFSDTPAETPYFEVYNSNRSLFEMLLTATHGSADGYFTEDNRVETRGIEEDGELKPVEGDGKIRVCLKDLPRERTLFTEKIQPIQKGIFNTCREINRITLIKRAGLSEKLVARRHARMIYRPKRDEISFFESLYHLENFGIFEFTEFKSPDCPSVIKRIQNLNQVLKNPDRVIQTGIWAPVVLKRMGLGFYTRLFGLNGYRKQFPNRGLLSLEKNFGRILFGVNRLKPKKWVKIAFFVGIPDICGGTYVILEHASRLQSMGYPVFILTEDRIDPKRYRWHPEAGNLKWLTFKDAENLTFDFAIATWWMSVFLLKKVSAATYAYFVQSIETRFFPDDPQATYEERLLRRLAERSYLLPLPVISIAHWIRGYLSGNYGRESQVVLNGIRKDLYSESDEAYEKRIPGRLRVLVEGPLGVPYKNVERAVELARRSDADEVWLLTSSAVLRYPGVDRVFSQVPISDTPKVYRSCDVLLKLSSVEGMFGPPLEMFHCGGTAIVYNVTGHDEYIRHGENSLVIEMDDKEAVLENLNLLKRKPKMLDRLKKGARETARGWPDWETSSKNFETALRSSYGKSLKNRSEIAKITEIFWERAENDVLNKSLHEALTGHRPASQSCQVFWHHGEGYTEENSKKIRYESDRWVTLEFRLMLPPGKIHLRIDPCMEPGVIYLEKIQISEGNGENSLLGCSLENRWQGMEIAGTASIIDDAKDLVVKAVDHDPQILLQPLNIDREGDVDIRVEISFKLISFPMKVRDLYRILDVENDNISKIYPVHHTT